jgi:hypothetical protein
LYLLDGWREAPDRKRVVIRNADGAARTPELTRRRPELVGNNKPDPGGRVE